MDEHTNTPPRYFIGSTPPEVVSPDALIQHMGVSRAVSAAYDVLADDGYPPEQAWRMALAAEKQGEDPESFARHFVKLRKALREVES